MRLALRLVPASITGLRFPMPRVTVPRVTLPRVTVPRVTVPRLSALAARIGLLVIPLGLLALSSCGKDSSGVPTGVSPRGVGSIPAIDVRGGDADSLLDPGKRAISEGDGGRGGLVRVTTVGDSNVTITADAPPPAPAFPQAIFPPDPVGGLAFLDVAGGQKVRVEGSYRLAWLRVRAGGTIQLVRSTVFDVKGDVEIAGVIEGLTSEDSLHAPDLTIAAEGIIRIAGAIRCSGRNGADPTQFETEKHAGGHGGHIYIQSDDWLLARSPGIYIAPGARIVANGGRSTSKGGVGAHAGRGGQILVGSYTGVAIAGRLAALGGRSYTTFAGSEGNGGAVEITATGGDIALYGVREINLAGGSSSGARAGRGGDLRIDAPSGAVTLDGFDVVTNGGRATYFATALGGGGGAIGVSARDLVASDAGFLAIGGHALAVEIAGGNAPATGGAGGAGGAVSLGASRTLRLGDDDLDPAVNALVPIDISADGGRTVQPGFLGGAGGKVALVNSSGDDFAFTFSGEISAGGGSGPNGLDGARGSVCTSGASLVVDASVVGPNDFPPADCALSGDGGLVLGDALSCDPSTGLPSTVEAELPTVLGLKAFRVVITDAMRLGEPIVAISTEGAPDGLLHLYVGGPDTFGSLYTSDYPWRDTSSGPSKRVCVDLGTVDPAAPFLSVLVVEMGPYVEAFTISVGCGDACP